MVNKKIVFFLVIIISEFVLIYYILVNYIGTISFGEITGLLSIVELQDSNQTPRYPFQGMTPNSSYLFDGYAVRLPIVTTISINFDGLRDREFNISKPNGTVRIIVLGDSVAFGWGVNNNETFAKFLERMLSNETKKYEVINLAGPGENTVDEIQRLKDKGLKYSPDIVIIAYHENDITNNTLFSEIATNYSHQLKGEKENENLTEYEINKKAEEMAGKYFSDMAPSFYKKTNWDNIYPPWKELYNLSVSSNVKVVIVAGTEIFQDKDWLEINKQVVTFFEEKVLPESKGLYFMNFQPIVMQYPRNQLMVHPLDGHPNPFAHKLIAEEIYKFLKQNSIA